MTRHRQFWLAVAALVVGSRGGAQTPGDTLPPVRPAGRLIDVGSWRLHLNCTGQTTPSQPIVILESGIGDFSVEWSLVQPGVARFARVCSYDRAGDGWSDLGPHPRTMHQIVYELHTLLGRAGERPPYVLVGHSYGGWLVRLYQSTYPSDVAGMVLVEAGGDNPLRMLADGRVVHASDLATGRPVPPVKTSNPLRESDIPPAALSQMKAGAAEEAAHANPGSRAKLPPDAQRMRMWGLARWQHVAAAVNPFEIEEIMGLRAERLKTEHPLGPLPLVVLTRGIAEEDGPDAAAREKEHRKEHELLTALSSTGQHVIATQSGHHVQLDEPQLVVTTIQHVVALTRKAPAFGSLVEHDSLVAVRESGPHAGGGETTAYPFFAEAPQLALVFRKRALHRGAAIGYHRQETDEVYYVLAGRGELTLDGVRREVAPGTAILTRSGSSHGLRQLGTEDLVIVVSYVQAQRER